MACEMGLGTLCVLFCIWTTALNEFRAGALAEKRLEVPRAKAPTLEVKPILPSSFPVSVVVAVLIFTHRQSRARRHRTGLQ